MRPRENQFFVWQGKKQREILVKKYTRRLGVHVHLSAARTVPGSEEDATLAALVLNILSAANQVRDASKTEADADTKGPSAVHDSSVDIWVSLD